MMILLMTAILLGAAPPEANPGPKDQPVKVMVLVILASDENDKIDGKLKEIAAEVSKKAPMLMHFELNKTHNESLKVGESVELSLVGAAKVQVTINKQTDAAGRMTITVKPPMLDAITYACTCGKFFPIITNHYTPDKKRLIIAVMAKPCMNK